MKPSKYNFIIHHDGKTLMYNSLNTALVEISPLMASLLEESTINEEKLAPYARRFLKEMEQGGFVIEDQVEEIKILQNLYNQAKYSRNTLSLTIAPTMGCNFKCVYCYEQGLEVESGSESTDFMLEDVQQALLQFVEQKIKTANRLQITWYGGEPLLALETIFHLSDKLIELATTYGVEYNADMVTNGFVIGQNPSLVKKLTAARVNSYQITLDGPPEVHNKRRPLKGHSEGATFATILSGIEELHKHELGITIRVNLDRNNQEEAVKLLDLLTAKGLTDIRVYPAGVRASSPGCQSLQSACLTSDEMAEITDNFDAIQKEKKFPRNESYPKLMLICSANSVNSFVISPNGDLYKCWNEIGQKNARCGSLTNQEVDRMQRMREINYLTWEPFEYTDCRECKALPSCMGGCLDQIFQVKGGKPDCPGQDFVINQVINSIVKTRKSLGENTHVCG